jgi:ABC-2 type transport system permease protein
MSQIVFRINYIMTGIGSMLYVPIVYFLWKAVYAGSNTRLINGMSFSEVFVYLILAAGVFNMLQTHIEWAVASHITYGQIVNELTKPVDYQLHLLFFTIGVVCSNLIMITTPTLLTFFLVFKPVIHLTLTNLIFFGIALILSFLISFYFDYIIGIISFYTKSILGFITAKEGIVMLLSGLIVPIRFFPEPLRRIVMWLPFQAALNIPVTIFNSPDLPVGEYLRLISLQAFWVAALFVIGRFLYNRAIRFITVSGG